jgi:hypothetical protein
MIYSIGFHPILTDIALSGLLKRMFINLKALKGRCLSEWGETLLKVECLIQKKYFPISFTKLNNLSTPSVFLCFE